MEDIQKLSFEEAFAELETIVERLENGDQPLEDAMQLYERGQQLTAYCQSLLEGAELRVRDVNDNQPE